MNGGMHVQEMCRDRTHMHVQPCQQLHVLCRVGI